MAWIESHQGLARHPKTKKLARILDVSLPASVGHLHFLWWWAMDYASDGNLSRYDSSDLADACEWEGDQQKIINALIESGFLEETHDGLFIHDWDEYAGRMIDKRKQNAERKRQSRGRHADVTETSKGQSGDGSRSHRATLPNHTLPNQTIPKDKKTIRSKKGEHDPSKSNYSERVWLKPEEYEKLLSSHGEESVKEMFAILDSYKASNGKAYDSDYHTMTGKGWVLQRFKEEQARATGGGTGAKYGRHTSKVEEANRRAADQDSDLFIGTPE